MTIINYPILSDQIRAKMLKTRVAYIEFTATTSEEEKARESIENDCELNVALDCEVFKVADHAYIIVSDLLTKSEIRCNNFNVPETLAEALNKFSPEQLDELNKLLQTEEGVDTLKHHIDFI